MRFTSGYTIFSAGSVHEDRCKGESRRTVRDYGPCHRNAILQTDLTRIVSSFVLQCER